MAVSGMTHRESQRERGKVKWFDDARGYGFIARFDGTDIFVHYSGIRGVGRRKLLPDQLVEFTVLRGEKGPMAVDVWVLG